MSPDEIEELAKEICQTITQHPRADVFDEPGSKKRSRWPRT